MNLLSSFANKLFKKSTKNGARKYYDMVSEVERFSIQFYLEKYRKKVKKLAFIQVLGYAFCVLKLMIQHKWEAFIESKQ